jgi:hypothetical protein
VFQVVSCGGVRPRSRSAQLGENRIFIDLSTDFALVR